MRAPPPPGILGAHLAVCRAGLSAGERRAAWPSEPWFPTCRLTLTCQNAVTAWQRNVIGFVTARTVDTAAKVQRGATDAEDADHAA